ncbi:hypothetical protein GCM10010425_59390 [Streptomyces spororaveus]|uniref:Uncharacterized protein n=1 Tax=Streptomyces spororaveus TaxID=284039 RepID=A0ABQ3T714_9ACTN|nr:hypothetical protein Sspor_17510 [Streptomyces spororaveus]
MFVVARRSPGPAEDPEGGLDAQRMDLTGWLSPEKATAPESGNSQTPDASGSTTAHE